MNIPFSPVNYVRNLQRKALMECLDHIAPEVCKDNAPEYLVLAFRYTQEVNDTTTTGTVHVHPALCVTLDEAQAFLHDKEGIVMKCSDLRDKYYTNPSSFTLKNLIL